jgi:L-ascorbate metabolism protein UlaG (beta-lactamase superfamily)
MPWLLRLSRTARRPLVCVVPIVLFAAAGCMSSVVQPSNQPLPRYEETRSGGSLTAYFLGTSSVLLRDGTTSILIDGFVSRPRFTSVLFGLIRPDTARIGSILKHLQVNSLAAVVTSHSDYDHAMDAPEFARRTGAPLLGSESTRQIGLGAGLNAGRLRVVRHGDTARFGEFHLTFLRSRHGKPNFFRGSVDAPLRPPSWAGAWRTDTVYALLIRHRDRTILFNGTAGFDAASLQGHRADVVYLASSGLAKRKQRWVDRYWNEVVRDRGACRVILVHWDNFFRSLDEPLEPMPPPLDSFAESVRRVQVRAAADSVDVRLPVLLQPADPFSGLEFQPGRRCRAPDAGRGT